VRDLLCVLLGRNLARGRQGRPGDKCDDGWKHAGRHLVPSIDLWKFGHRSPYEPLLSGSDQLFPCQSVANCALHLVDSLLREFRNLLHQVNFRNRSQIVAVNNAGLGHSLDRPERNFDRNMANGRRDFSRNKLVENRISVITAQQKHGAAPGWFRQVRPPDFVLLQGFHSSALDQSSASSAESGCRKYASRMASYSRFRIASLTAWRMNSARCRLAAGATLFSDRKSGSSNWINIEGIY
jgi:hypothetical protein